MSDLTATRHPGIAKSSDVHSDLERHRAELTAHCYRMLGSAFDADDAVQDTLVRAWRAHDRFDGRASLRTWLYRIATNVCLDHLRSRQRRARPIDLGPAAPTGRDHPGGTLPEATWVEPIPDHPITPATSDPADVAVTRETVRLGFIAALQHLPPRQRAVLLLRDALVWPAAEVADLLETSVAAVNSALQRARATLATTDRVDGDVHAPTDPAQQALLTRWVDAFERYDLDAITALLADDVTQSMPPYAMWLHGTDAIRQWWLGPGAACRGSQLVATTANGLPAFGQYRPSGPDGRHEPWALQVLAIADGHIADMTFFLDTDRLFPLFELPSHPSS